MLFARPAGRNFVCQSPRFCSNSTPIRSPACSMRWWRSTLAPDQLLRSMAVLTGRDGARPHLRRDVHALAGRSALDGRVRRRLQCGCGRSDCGANSRHVLWSAADVGANGCGRLQRHGRRRSTPVRAGTFRWRSNCWAAPGRSASVSPRLLARGRGNRPRWLAGVPKRFAGG